MCFVSMIVVDHRPGYGQHPVKEVVIMEKSLPTSLALFHLVMFMVNTLLSVSVPMRVGEQVTEWS